MNKAEKAAIRVQAKADYMSGMSYRDIAAKHGISVGLVAKWSKADAWEMDSLREARKTEREQNKKREREQREREQREHQDPRQSALEMLVAEENGEDPTDFDLLRQQAVLVVAHINQRLLNGKVLEPRDIKSITGALLDLKNQLNALSPRELREMALRLRSLEKQNETVQAEPVVVKFVNREWEDADN